MKRFFKLIIITLLGIILSLGFHTLPQVIAGQPIENQRSALALVLEGKKHYDAGQFSEAIEVLHQAAKVYEDEGEILKQIQALSLISLAQQRLGNWQEAEKTINLSFALLEEIPQSSEQLLVQAQVLNSQGHLQLAKGKAEDALKIWQETETLYGQSDAPRSGSLRDPIGVIGSKINQAQALETLGFYRKSCNKVLQALHREDVKCENLTPEKLQEIRDILPTKSNSLQIISLRSLGNVLRLIGKLDESENILKQSLEIANKLDSPPEKSKILLSLGNIQQALANQAQELKNQEGAQNYNQAALEYYRQAIETANLLQKPLLLIKIQAQLNQLSLLIKTENWLEAQTILPQIQMEIVKLPPSRISVYSQVNFAQSLTKMVDKQKGMPIINYQDIATRLENAIEDAREIGDKRAESYALGNLGQLQYEHKLPLASKPQNLLQEALSIAANEQASEITYRWQWQLGRIYKDSGEQKKAIAFYQNAFQTLQQLRGDLLSLNRDIQFSFTEQVEPVYRQLAELLLQPEAGETQPSQENLKEARDTLEALQLAELENFFQDSCSTSQKTDIEKIDSHAAVIYTMILENRLEVILSLPNGKLSLYTNLVRQTEVEENAQKLQQYLKEPDRLKDVQKISQQIYSWLIKPFEDQIESKLDFKDSNIKTLVFVLDGSLKNIPMSVLYDGENYLLQRYATAITPGLQLLRPELDSVSKKINALIAGISEKRLIGEQEFTALEKVEDEWRAIQSVVSNETLLNSQFTKNNFQKQLNSNPFSVVHIATHGQFSSDPQGTFILLWNQVLNVKDFNNLLQQENQLDSGIIDLLVLSACETATGDKRAALGLAGVAIRTGARSTLATLWQVNDESTAQLMSLFYQQLIENSTITKAEALRQAQLKLWENKTKDWVVPSFWASYVLVGNWL